MKSLRMKWAGNVALMGDRTGACTVLVRTAYWKKSFMDRVGVLSW